MIKLEQWVTPADLNLKSTPSVKAFATRHGQVIVFMDATVVYCNVSQEELVEITDPDEAMEVHFYDDEELVVLGERMSEGEPELADHIHPIPAAVLRERISFNDSQFDQYHKLPVRNVAGTCGFSAVRHLFYAYNQDKADAYAEKVISNLAAARAN